MIDLRLTLSSFALLALALPAAAQPAFDLRRLTGDDPGVGQAAAVEARGRSEVRSELRDGERVLRRTGHRTGTDAAYVEEVLELGDGVRRGRRVYERFVEVAGDRETALDVAGLAVVLTTDRTGTRFAPAEGNDRRPPGALALQLQTEVQTRDATGSGEDDVDPALLPEAPVPVGATWPIAPLEAARVVGLDPGDLDAERCGCTGLLEAADRHEDPQRLRVTLTLHLAIRTLQGRPLLEPALLSTTIVAEVPVDPASADVEVRVEGMLEAVHAGPPGSPPGATVVLSTYSESSYRRRRAALVQFEPR